MRGQLEEILKGVRAEGKVRFGIDCSDDLSLADACAVESLRCGVREIKAASFPLGCASLANVVRILALKGEKMGVSCGVRREEIHRVTSQIETLCRTNMPSQSILSGLQDSGEEAELSFHDSRESILRSVEQLGYILSPDDQEKVFSELMQYEKERT